MEAAHASRVFQEVFDTDQNKLVDALEVMCAVAMLSKAAAREKVDFIHSLYDFAGTGELSFDEVTILFRTVSYGCGKTDKKARQHLFDATRR
jgi:Ca2+-binding EF-hand superfamily protein